MSQQATTHKTAGVFAKYRALILLIATFFALVIFLSSLTFVVSNRVGKASQELEVSAQQSVLVQQLSKNLFDINLYFDSTTKQLALNNISTSDASNDVIIAIDDLPQSAIYQLEEIEKQYEQFDKTLNAFKSGGTVKDTLGNEVLISATDDPEQIKTLERIQTIWTPYQGLLQHFIEDNKKGVLSKNTTQYLMDYTRLYNLSLNNETSEYTSHLNTNIQKQTEQLRLMQIAGVALAFFIFLGIVFGALRRLLRSDEKLAIARQQTDDIMRTVNEGLFLIDKELIISNQYSGKLEKILNEKDIAGRNLYDLLSGMISEKDMNTTKLFVEQLYNPWVVEELIQDLNPLKQVRLSYNDENGVAVSKFVEFNFLRVMDMNQEDIDSVFVSVTDITKEVHLQAQMQKDKEQHHHQIEMISYLLSVDNRQIVRFINDTQSRLERMNDTLKDTSIHNLKDKAEQLYRDTHSLKGDASALKLTALVILAHKQEDHLKQLMRQPNLQGDDFLPFTVGLNEMMEMTSFIEDLLTRLRLNEINEEKPSVSSLINPDTNPTKRAEDTYWKDYFTTYGQDIAKRQNKQINIEVVGFDEMDIDEKTMSIYKDIVTQLLKNAIVHGIEKPSRRANMGKDQTGVITISLTSSGKTHELQVKDDGKGIDWQKIRQKAVELGMHSQEEVNKFKAKELVALMFTSGISTASAENEDAGRGVGTNIIKQLTQSLGGKMKIQSHANQFTQININFPNRG